MTQYADKIKYYNINYNIKIESLKNIPNISPYNLYLLKNLELLLNSEDYSDKFDEDISRMVEDILKKNTNIQPIIDLIKLLNKLSTGSRVNFNFNTDITVKIIELINKIQSKKYVENISK